MLQTLLLKQTEKEKGNCRNPFQTRVCLQTVSPITVMADRGSLQLRKDSTCDIGDDGFQALPWSGWR